MADILKSRNAKGLELAKTFKKLVAYLNKQFASQILSPLTITLGDEFQGVLQNEYTGYQIIIAAEEWLLGQQQGFKIRYMLHYGLIETPINHKIAYGMLGIGLAETREYLGDMKKSKDRFKVSGTPEDGRINNYWLLYQHIVDGWKPKDKEVVASFLQLEDYKLVAKQLDKTVSLLWKREHSLNIREYKIIKDMILKS